MVEDGFGSGAKEGIRVSRKRSNRDSRSATEYDCLDVAGLDVVGSFIDEAAALSRSNQPVNHDVLNLPVAAPPLSLEPILEAEDVDSDDDDGELPVWNDDDVEAVPSDSDFELKLSAIVGMVTRMLPVGDPIAIEDIRAVVKEAIQSTDDIYGKQQAIEAGGGYRFPPGIVDRDLLRFAAAGFSLEEMTRLEHERISEARLNFDRIRAVVDPSIHSTDDMDRLHELVEGMVVIVDEDVASVEYFIPRGVPPPQRALYLEVQSAVNSVIGQLHEQDLLFLLPTQLVKLIPGCHFTPIHWTTKKGKRVGRILFDAKDSKFGSALNSINAKLKLKEKCGPIHHPTIVTIVHMVLKFADAKKEELGEAFNWEDLHMFKLDLANAFSLLFFRPEYSKRMICELTDAISVVYHVGQFGWVGTPYYFQIITRILSAEINQRLGSDGSSVAYVDDIIAVCLSKDFEGCQSRAIYVIKALLGDSAHAVDKDEDGRVVECIGWLVDLDKRLLTLSRRNFLKVLYGFFVVDVSKPVGLNVLNPLCSYSARYTLVLPILKALTNILYGEKKRLGNNKSARIELSPLGRIAIKMWRAVLILLRLRETTYARTLDSFRIVLPVWQIESDASLTGLGVLVRDLRLYVPGDEMSGVVKVCSVDLPFELHMDSRYQNTVEFLGATLGLAMLAQLGIGSTSVKMKGDSRSSLKWGTTGLFSGVLSQRTSFVFMFVSVQYNLFISEGEHVAGELHVTCDRLSRGVRPLELGFSPEMIYDVEFDLNMLAIIELCNPAPENDILDEESFMDFWVIAREHVAQL